MVEPDMTSTNKDWLFPTAIILIPFGLLGLHGTSLFAAYQSDLTGSTVDRLLSVIKHCCGLKTCIPFFASLFVIAVGVQKLSIFRSLTIRVLMYLLTVVLGIYAIALPALL